MNLIINYIIAILLSFAVLAICILVQFFVKNRILRNVVSILCVILVVMIALYCYFEIRIPFLRAILLE